MRLAMTFFLVICAGLLTTVVTGPARPARAQDATDQGSWSGPQGSGADYLNQTLNAPPMALAGCWSGAVSDTADGAGTVTFEFHQNKNHKKLRIGSTFSFQWGDGAFAEGPLKGSVTSTGFKFKGNAGANCKVTGIATGDDTGVTGTVVFAGGCANLFQNVTFSIAPGC
jgi:hypothetical protein